jgi:hypothetical protein
MTLKVKPYRGDPHPYMWPKIASFLTLEAINFITNHLEENKEWNVCEKIDGCNVCVSSEGWIASRNKIIGRIDEPKLKDQYFQKAPLRQLVSLHETVVKLQTHLAQTFFSHEPNFELLLYGELILPGTASTKEDIYKYKEKYHLENGDVCVFAMGIVLENKMTMPFLFKHGFYQMQENPFFVVPMNFGISALLREFDIQHLAPLKTDLLQNLLNNDTLRKNIKKRNIEGYVLTGNTGGGFIKWKYYKQWSPTLFDQMNLLIKSQTTKTAKATALGLQELFDYDQKFACTWDNNFLVNKLTHFLNVNDTEIYTLLKEAAEYGTFYYNLKMNEIVQRLYCIVKKSTYHKIDPLVKMKLKKRIAIELKNQYHDELYALSSKIN